ncbi:VanZ family protein [Paenibacillus terrigena]|uniref:VanZ family protein n=1 Tax=Paenibacillus terrigena TaxID=369333 RepID=UPI0028D1A527|nr:VanZ family protein [Paenibacillus terrigena]
MYQGKLRKITIILLVLYTFLMFYFLYFGFNRTAFTHTPGFWYNLIPEGIPLHFPIESSFGGWFFELGNFIAFIPFGAVIPLLYRCSFIRFIALFVLSITILETIQMLTQLGVFDIDDILVNSMGAAVGFWAQRLVSRDRDQLIGICRIILIAIALSTSVVVMFGGVNYYLEKETGEVIAIHELTVNKGTVQWDKPILSFTANDTKVEPQLNLYSRKNTRTNTFTYLLNGKYTRISGYAAIPDDVIKTASHGGSEVIFIADGTQVYSLGLTAVRGENQLTSFEIPLNGANELTIKIMNEDPNPATNVALWDIALAEVNRGQKIVNRMKEIMASLF